ncbi:MAG: metal-dependent hydrolase [Stenotrophobium sp.]
MTIARLSKIVTRRIPFEFPNDIQPHWIPGKPELAHMMNGGSLTMPYLEPFLIRTLREALQKIDDPVLRADGEAFMSQEGQHFRAHRRFNDTLKANGYPELAGIETEMEKSYARLAELSLPRRLAYTAGFESMTMGVTRWLIGERRALFSGADNRVVSFVLWHMVEETEHKTVAFDTYQAVCGNYFTRVIGVLHGSFDVMRFSMRGYKLMLKKDGLWSSWRSRLLLAAEITGFMRHVGPYLLRALLPWHSPRFERDLDWVSEWIARFPSDGTSVSIPLVDTSHPDMPVPTMKQVAA